MLSLYNSPAERETEIKNMSSVFKELKEEVLPELRRSQIVNSTDLQGKTDAEIMAAFRNGQELTVEEYLYAAETLANGRRAGCHPDRRFKEIQRRPRLQQPGYRTGQGEATRLLRSNRSRRLPRWIRRAKSPRTSSWATWPTATPPRLRSMPRLPMHRPRPLSLLPKATTKAAAQNLDGYNEAVAQVMSNNLSAAKQAISKDNSADADYLRAVIAVKEGDLKTAEAQLKSAVSKNPKLAQKAANDINLKALNK